MSILRSFTPIRIVSAAFKEKAYLPFPFDIQSILYVRFQRRSSGGVSRWSWVDAWGKGSGWGCACGEAARRVATVCCATLALLAARLHVMGAQLPVFTRFDNPAGAAAPPAR